MQPAFFKNVIDTENARAVSFAVPNWECLIDLQLTTIGLRGGMPCRLTDLIAMIGLPVLIGQFLSDWIGNDLPSAASHLPIRAFLIFAVLLAWAVLRARHERKKQTFH